MEVWEPYAARDTPPAPGGRPLSTMPHRPSRCWTWPIVSAATSDRRSRQPRSMTGASCGAIPAPIPAPILAPAVRRRDRRRSDTRHDRRRDAHPTRSAAPRTRKAREEARSEIADAMGPVTTPTGPAYSRAVRRLSPPASVNSPEERPSVSAATSRRRSAQPGPQPKSVRKWRASQPRRGGGSAINEGCQRERILPRRGIGVQLRTD